jgi:hypothetical protein
MQKTVDTESPSLQDAESSLTSKREFGIGVRHEDRLTKEVSSEIQDLTADVGLILHLYPTLR